MGRVLYGGRRGRRYLRPAPNGGYGNCVMIDHGNGVVTVYAHMSSIGVSYGQYVTAGQYVGAVGSTGVSTGPHCHFEIRINGAQTDPAGVLLRTFPIGTADFPLRDQRSL